MTAASLGTGRAIWLASYPKSGNTWLRLALRSVQLGGAPVPLDEIASFGQTAIGRRLFDSVLEADSGHMTSAELEALRPALHDAYFAEPGAAEPVKVHDRWFRTAAGSAVFDPRHTRAAIYVLRDPRDVAVSWARFVDKTLDQAVAFMADRQARTTVGVASIHGGIGQYLGSWSDNVTSWIDESGLSPLVVRYEDMLADTPAALARIAAYLSWDASAATIDGAVAATRFDRLAAEEARSGFVEKPHTAERFFVSGRSGGWRDVLSAAQVDRLEVDHGAVMARFGYL